MQYVGGDARRSDCVFCGHIADGEDAASLILLRGKHAFVIMNIFPYNTGHVMLVPYAHVASPELLSEPALLEMATLRNRMLQAIRVALSPGGFNVGINLGETAGAGITAHVHEHLVPRWLGDANFMPIVGGTKVLPELLPATYAKLRAEIERTSATIEVPGVYFSRSGEDVFVLEGGLVPRVSAASGAAIWRALLHDATAMGLRGLEVMGWGGRAASLNDAPIIIHRLTTQLDENEPKVGTWVPLSEAVSGPDGSLLKEVCRQASFAGPGNR